MKKFIAYNTNWNFAEKFGVDYAKGMNFGINIEKSIPGGTMS